MKQINNRPYLNNTLVFKRFYNFSGGENELLLPKKILKTLKNITVADLHEAPDLNGGEIKKKIGQVFGIGPGMITLGNGSDEIIENIPRVFLEPGESVLVVVPTFFRFIESSRRMKARVIVAKREQTDLIRIIERKQPKIIWFCSPNNPTGEVMSLSTIEHICHVSKHLVVVDEAFQEFSDPEYKRSAIRLLKKYRNLLILKTFSKPWGLGGVRFGFAIGAPKIISLLEQWRLPFNVNNITRKLVLTLLNDFKRIKTVARKTSKNRQELFKEIKKLTNLDIGADSRTNLFILRHKNKDLFKELLKKRILTADFRQANGLEGRGFVRITIKSRKENQILLKALREIN